MDAVLSEGSRRFGEVGNVPGYRAQGSKATTTGISIYVHDNTIRSQALSSRYEAHLPARVSNLATSLADCEKNRCQQGYILKGLVLTLSGAVNVASGVKLTVDADDFSHFEIGYERKARVFVWVVKGVEENSRMDSRTMDSCAGSVEVMGRAEWRWWGRRHRAGGCCRFSTLWVCLLIGIARKTGRGPTASATLRSGNLATSRFWVEE